MNCSHRDWNIDLGIRSYSPIGEQERVSTRKRTVSPYAARQSLPEHMQSRFDLPDMRTVVQVDKTTHREEISGFFRKAAPRDTYAIRRLERD